MAEINKNQLTLITTFQSLSIKEVDEVIFQTR